jgi:hypothetical protein
VIHEDLAAVWIGFADTSCRDYSPLYDAICRAVAGSDEVLALVREARPESHLPNVLLGAVHYLVLGGANHPLATVYQGDSAGADAGALFVDFCLSHRAEVLSLLETRHTNTNEVGRSAVLGPALTFVAAAEQAGSPLALVDVGCSAGLNLLCDRYLLDYGSAGTTGPADSPLRLACSVAGGRPPIAAALPPIAARVGLDRDPVDVHDDDATRWLLACVWPDTGRLPRTRTALALAREASAAIVQGDAVDAIGGVIASLPDDAVAVVLTTWALVYLSPTRRLAFADALAAASAARARPVAWISGESPGVVASFSGVSAPSDEQGMLASLLGLVVFEDGAERESKLLGFVHPHGNWIDWRA